jgi:SAM-dependent methyltransferase
VSQFEEEWRRRFERFGMRHDSEHLVSGWSLAGLRQRVATFERLLDTGLVARGGRILELGCAAGTYVRLLGKRGHAVVGLDYSLPSLGRAVHADPGHVGCYAAGSAYALPFAKAVFNAVICIGVLQAIEDPETVLVEIERVLAPGGRVLVETLNPWNPVAVGRRLTALVRREQTRLRYQSPSRVRRGMLRHGMRDVRQIGVVLPPKSLPGMGEMLARAGVQRVLGFTPGVGFMAAHAFWVVGTKT